MVLRLVKIILVLQIGLFALLVAYDNIVDYGTNYAFVRHVLTMDTTFPGNHLMDRAIGRADLSENLAAQCNVCNWGAPFAGPITDANQQLALVVRRRG